MGRCIRVAEQTRAVAAKRGKPASQRAQASRSRFFVDVVAKCVSHARGLAI